MHTFNDKVLSNRHILYVSFYTIIEQYPPYFILSFMLLCENKEDKEKHTKIEDIPIKFLSVKGKAKIWTTERTHKLSDNGHG